MSINKEEELKKLGNRIKELRIKNNLSISSICYKHGMEPSTFSRIERGIVEPKYLSLLQISKSLKMDLSEVLKF